MTDILVPVHLVRQLLNRDKAHRTLLTAYRTGSLFNPSVGHGIDTLNTTTDAPLQLQALLDAAEVSEAPAPGKPFTSGSEPWWF